MFKGKIEKAPFTTGLIRKITVDLSAAFVDKKITIAGWQTVLATTDYTVAQHLTFKIHDPHNASIPLLPFCAIEDKWIKEIYLTNDADQDGVSVDFLISNPPTKLNYAGISLPSSGGNGEPTTEIRLYTESNILLTTTNKNMRMLGISAYISSAYGDSKSIELYVRSGGIYRYRYSSPVLVSGSYMLNWIPGLDGSITFIEGASCKTGIMPLPGHYQIPIIGNGMEYQLVPGMTTITNRAFIYEQEI